MLFFIWKTVLGNINDFVFLAAHFQCRVKSKIFHTIESYVQFDDGNMGNVRRFPESGVTTRGCAVIMFFITCRSMWKDASVERHGHDVLYVYMGGFAEWGVHMALG